MLWKFLFPVPGYVKKGFVGLCYLSSLTGSLWTFREQIRECRYLFVVVFVVVVVCHWGDEKLELSRSPPLECGTCQCIVFSWSPIA